ncbi:hypothetical protein H632_c4258p0, partial [Helicosporidium sp. ATCC 50920]
RRLPAAPHAPGPGAALGGAVRAGLSGVFGDASALVRVGAERVLAGLGGAGRPAGRRAQPARALGAGLAALGRPARDVQRRAAQLAPQPRRVPAPAGARREQLLSGRRLRSRRLPGRRRLPARRHAHAGHSGRGGRGPVRPSLGGRRPDGGFGRRDRVLLFGGDHQVPVPALPRGRRAPGPLRALHRGAPAAAAGRFLGRRLLAERPFKLFLSSCAFLPLGDLSFASRRLLRAPRPEQPLAPRDGGGSRRAPPAPAAFPLGARGPSLRARGAGARLLAAHLFFRRLPGAPRPGALPLQAP